MALTKVSRGLLSTGIVDNSNATAITIGSDESVTLAGTLSLPNANATNEISFTGTEFTNVLSATTGGFQLGTTGAGYLQFLTNNTARMTIDNDGSVTVPGTLHSPGHVIQTVYAENSTVVVPSQTQNDFTTLVQVNITPKDATSKILINGMAAVNLNGGNYPAIHARIYRGSTQVKSMLYWGYEGSQTHHRILNQPVHFLDSPATTSALTYYVKIANASGSTYTGTYTARGNSYNTSTISVQEIAQ